MTKIESFTEINQLPQDEFVSLLADIYEHSPWVASEAWVQKPFASLTQLHTTMNAVVKNSSEERQLVLLRAHPELAGKAAQQGDLTQSSQGEQKGAGLTALKPDEMAHISQLNQNYREKFQFPFIIAVKNHTKSSIFSEFERRLQNERNDELETAIEQVCMIAGFRLRALFEADE
jgi:2-oxo-4-hydroxy-4-carboxy-5-ureidoimidazoline decarboxylase